MKDIINQCVSKFLDEDEEDEDQWIKNAKYVTELQSKENPQGTFCARIDAHVDLIEDEHDVKLYVPKDTSKDAFVFKCPGLSFTTLASEVPSSEEDGGDDIEDEDGDVDMDEYKTNVRRVWMHTLQRLHKKRNDTIDMYAAEETPTTTPVNGSGSNKNNKNKPTKETWGEVIDLDAEEEEEEEDAAGYDEEEVEIEADDSQNLHASSDSSSKGISLQAHASTTNSFYGNQSTSVIKNLDNLRLRIFASDLTDQSREQYGLKTAEASIILSIQFRPDYVGNGQVPEVQYKPETIDVKNSFGEHVENIAREFMTSYFPRLHQLFARSERSETITQKQCFEMLAEDPKLGFINGVVLSEWADEDSAGQKKSTRGGSAASAAATTQIAQSSAEVDLRSVQHNNILGLDRKGKIKVIKSALQQRKQRTAIALALFCTKFQATEAAQLFMDAGGSLDAIDDLLASEADNRFNIVLQLATYLYLRLIRPTANCLICDSLIHKPFVRDSPMICTSNKCIFRYLDLRVCREIPVNICPSSIAQDIRENDIIVDLLICMTYSTATSNRRELIFDPFPDMFKDSHGKPKFDAVVQTLNLFPSVEEMKKYCDSEHQLRAFLDTKGDQVYTLLWWILSCKRIALMKLPEQRQIKGLPTKHQYLMQMDTPAKDKQFSTWRKQYGSYFAWHGSGLENWSGIMRKGLLNASNTKLMTTGAAYGPGIYMAPDSATSFGYARLGGLSWPKSQFTNATQLQCLALCEVVKHPNVPTVPNPYYVIRQEECVATRFFIFFTGEQTRTGQGYAGQNLNIQASSLDLHKYI